MEIALRQEPKGIPGAPAGMYDSDNVALSGDPMSNLFEDLKELTDHEIQVALAANRPMKIMARHMHPVIQQFDSCSDDEYKALVADMRVNGQKRAIALYHGKVLDGRARYWACFDLKIVPKVFVLRGSDPRSYLFRRHPTRFGKQGTPERTDAEIRLWDLVTGKWVVEYKAERKFWIADARKEFNQLMRYRNPEPCAVCGLRKEYSHAHHSLPLSYQFEMGFDLYDHTSDWLCAVHHKLMHRLIGHLITGASRKYLPSEDFLRGDALKEREAAMRVFKRGLEIFLNAGGIPYDQRWEMTAP